jgi:hypothetical protein
MCLKVELKLKCLQKDQLKRGFVPYEIPNTPEGYALAKATLKSPLDPTTINQDKGKELYTFIVQFATVKKVMEKEI